MASRIRVTEAELRELWMSDDAVGIELDYASRSKVVRMRDGVEYETPFTDLSSGGGSL